MKLIIQLPVIKIKNSVYVLGMLDDQVELLGIFRKLRKWLRIFVDVIIN